MRERPDIPEERLRAVVREEYDLAVVTVEFLPLGLDSNAGIYRLTSGRGTAYALKAKRGAFYEPSCLVPRYLQDQGITSVVAPLPTARGALWATIGEWTISVYPFVEGETGKRLGMSGENWRDVGATFRRIHAVALPPEATLRQLRKETFDPGEYRRWLAMFEARQMGTEGGSAFERALRTSWMWHRSTIHTLMSTMEDLAHLLRRQSGPLVICHADLHANNILINRAGRAVIIDWDDVMLAPKERDFLFVGVPAAADSAPREAPPFYQGYAETAVDWVALTYYWCERVVTDLIEDARNVFFRDDLGDETKAVAVQMFSDQFVEGGGVTLAFAAAAHLPPGLGLRMRPEPR